MQCDLAIAALATQNMPSCMMLTSLPVLALGGPPVLVLDTGRAYVRPRDARFFRGSDRLSGTTSPYA